MTEVIKINQFIQDYLNTQGFKLDVLEVEEHVEMLYILWQNADIQSLSINELWQVKDTQGQVWDIRQIIDDNPDNQQKLGRLFALFDSVLGQFEAQEHLSIFLIHEGYLKRIVCCGLNIDTVLPLHEDKCEDNLIIRTACTAWGQIDTAKMYLCRTRSGNTALQWALPLTLSSGQVFGVVYGEASIASLADNPEWLIWQLALTIVCSLYLNQYFS